MLPMRRPPSKRGQQINNNQCHGHAHNCLVTLQRLNAAKQTVTPPPDSTPVSAMTTLGRLTLPTAHKIVPHMLLCLCVEARRGARHYSETTQLYPDQFPDDALFWSMSGLVR